jgi:ketol-acid reductoisomerase
MCPFFYEFRIFVKMRHMRIGIIGSGSWATAIAKIVTDNGHDIFWWVRQSANIDYFKKRHHNPHYLRNAYFDVSKLNFSDDVSEVINNADIIIMAMPSIHAEATLAGIDKEQLKNKTYLSIHHLYYKCIFYAKLLNILSTRDERLYFADHFQSFLASSSKIL